MTLYRMSQDLSEKIDGGLIRFRSETEEILGVKEFGKIPLSQPACLIATIPWYPSLRFDGEDVLLDHWVVGD